MHEKTGKYYHRMQKIPFIVHMFINLAQKFDYSGQFVLSKLPVTHYGGKLSGVGELSLTGVYKVGGVKLR